MRDDLANERTFLAYVRTALAFIAFGFVIARFSLFAREISVVAHVTVPTTHLSSTLGTAMAFVGVIVGLYGSSRYLRAKAAIAAGGTATMPLWAAVAGGLVVAATGIIVATVLYIVH
jgi:putative membrane protein